MELSFYCLLFPFVHGQFSICSAFAFGFNIPDSSDLCMCYGEWEIYYGINKGIKPQVKHEMYSGLSLFGLFRSHFNLHLKQNRYFFIRLVFNFSSFGDFIKFNCMSKNFHFIFNHFYCPILFSVCMYDFWLWQINTTPISICFSIVWFCVSSVVYSYNWNRIK